MESPPVKHQPMSSSSIASSSPLPSSFQTVNTSYAFLVHSQDTLPNNLPPSVDNKPLARQRRRRTRYALSQFLFEAAGALPGRVWLSQQPRRPQQLPRLFRYLGTLTGHVSPQIWFQNRRQTSRRKSKPLEPHELWDPRGQKSLDATNRPDMGQDASELNNSALISSSPRNASSSPPAITRHTTSQTLENGLGIDVPTAEDIDRDPSMSFGLQTDAAEGRIILSQDSIHHQTTQHVSQTTHQTLRPDELSSHQTSPTALHSTEQPPQSTSTRSLKRSASAVRLSLTSDYTAKVLQPDEASPSPPKPQRHIDMLPLPRSSLRRSHSTAGLSDPSASAPGFNRATSGRSRDSRAWEFWCDRDSRSDLMKQAEAETRGSAADAISLIRSSSQRSALSPLTITRGHSNTLEPARRTFKRVKSTHHDTTSSHPRRERAKLSRASTSIGRLETSHKRDSGIGMDVHVDPSPSSATKHAAVAADANDDDDDDDDHDGCCSYGSPSGDSDKENHDPDDADEHVALALALAHRRAAPKAARPRPRLSGSQTAPLASARRFGANRVNVVRRRERVHGGAAGKYEYGADGSGENADPEDDAEIAAFMGRRASASGGAVRGGRDEDDMDCVQGLLSLSQGAWR
ncbi:hypothetical protein FH972_021855 [Carpinus fangiana]|uniref:Homeobox domain-containing protein n=1 Tax=Carpinus fangiana TaxID=176857 RepID=A0A5N6KQJ5_9ROSI|nr:hypothetical protein FH972_021855 [Carpinus fangiana]